MLVLNSLKLIAKVLKKDENKQHILPIIIAATEDKSWRVRLSLSKIFSEVKKLNYLQSIKSITYSY